MNKEKLKKIKVLYYPYRCLKSIINCLVSVNNKICGFVHLKRNKNRHIENSKIKVLFILQYIPSWEKGDFLYNYLRQQQDFDVYILCVPNDIKNQTSNEVYEYLSQKDYKIINAVTDSGWYNINSLKPDYIFTFRPYDSFMPTNYSANELSKSGKLCNIIYGPPMTTELQEVVYNKYFFDYVSIFFSENLESQEYFENKHSLGVKTGLQKAPFCGMPILEYIHKGKFIDESSAWGEINKTKILWTPRWNTDEKIGGSHFFDYKEVICSLPKKERCNVMIRPHPLMFSNFENTGEMTKDKYGEFLSECEKNDIIIDFSKSYLHTFADTDILITDLSSIVQEFLILGKPIIYCPPTSSVHHTKTMDRIISSCYVANNSTELISIIHELLQGHDKLSQARKSVLKELFGNTINESCSLICNILRTGY